MTAVVADGNGEGQVMLAIHDVNLVRRFIWYILKERKIKPMKSEIKCIVMWLRWTIADWSLRMKCVFYN